MVANHFRWDFIGLSTDDKPTADNPRVADGSTYYESDTSKVYVWYKTQWYEKEAGGSYELPIASDTTLGGVKVGEGLSIDAESGVLSASGGGGSQIGGTILTSAMYNYPAENPDGVALWLLPAGVYYLTSDDNTTKVYRTSDWITVGNDAYSTYFVSQQYSDVKLILLVHPYGGSVNMTTESYINFEWYRINVNSGSRTSSWFEPNSRQALLTNSDVKDSLTSTARWLPLSANQGKALKDLIDALDARVSALEGN